MRSSKDADGDHGVGGVSAEDLHRYFSTATLDELEDILRLAWEAELGHPPVEPDSSRISPADLVSFKGSWRALITFLEHLITQRRGESGS